ncbi:hypothetical protein BHE74_00018898 [Ensete ventricosum]|nr:hypothetical protein BHE74_00018898 [Ensete ventricosum]RZR91504.1 hypothetical protein BHM03_00019639 [Ensete ventricosum]
MGIRRETRQKFAEGIRSLSGVRRELVRGDQEVAMKASGVCWKKTKRLIRRSLGVAEKLAGNDAVGNSPEVHRELAKGIRSLLGWRQGVRRKKIETHRKIFRGSQKAYRELRRS